MLVREPVGKVNCSFPIFYLGAIAVHGTYDSAIHVVYVNSLYHASALCEYVPIIHTGKLSCNVNIYILSLHWCSSFEII